MNYCGSIKGMDNHGETIGKLSKCAQIMHLLPGFLRTECSSIFYWILFKENAMHNKFEFENLGITTML